MIGISPKEVEGQIAAFEARLLRLDAEMKLAGSLNLPEDLCENARNVCQSEQNFFRASKAEYASSTRSLKASIALAERESTMKRQMADEDILPEIDALDARQSLEAERAKLSEYQSEYRTIRSKEYAETVTEINALKAQLGVRQDQLTRTALKSPVRAIVNKVHINTIGGVAPAGEPILELTPLDEELRIEAKISPQDVAFIRPGMDATVKLTAYDYTIYGTLAGNVTHVSADTFQEEGIRDEKPYYKVFVAAKPLDNNDLSSKIEVRPGMVAEVELNTGSKTVMQYLLKPLFKSTEALTER